MMPFKLQGAHLVQLDRLGCLILPPLKSARQPAHAMPCVLQAECSVTSDS
jgi:hypothetical protein